MRGRKPKPITQQIAEGDPRKRGQRKLRQQLAAQPKPARGLPQCPEHLSGVARDVWNLWREELEAMKQDHRPDAMMLEGACVNYATAVKAHEIIEGMGEVIQEPIIARESGEIVGTRMKKNPWVEVRNRAWMLTGKFCSEFGLSPVSRTRLPVEKLSDGKETDDLLTALSRPRERKVLPVQ